MQFYQCALALMAWPAISYGNELFDKTDVVTSVSGHLRIFTDTFYPVISDYLINSFYRFSTGLFSISTTTKTSKNKFENKHDDENTKVWGSWEEEMEEALRNLDIELEKVAQKRILEESQTKMEEDYSGDDASGYEYENGRILDDEEDDEEDDDEDEKVRYKR